MKKITLVVILLNLLLSGCLQNKATKNVQTENSMLWKISGNGLTAPSYLFGTMHAVCGENFVFSNKLKNALNNTNAIYFEVDINQMKDPAAIMKYMKSEKPITEGLTKQEIHELDSLLLVNNIKLDQVKNINPAILISLLTQTQLSKCKNGFKLWESELNEFYDAKKKRGAFETIEQQMGVLNSIYDVKTLIASLKTSNDATFIDMSKIYGAEKLSSLDSLMTKGMNDFSSEKTDLFLYNRNKNWVALMPDIMKTQATIFAVGAGHLAGSKGVIHLLKSKGYQVTAVLN